MDGNYLAPQFATNDFYHWRRYSAWLLRYLDPSRWRSAELLPLANHVIMISCQSGSTKLPAHMLPTNWFTFVFCKGFILFGIAEKSNLLVTANNMRCCGWKIDAAQNFQLKLCVYVVLPFLSGMIWKGRWPRDFDMNFSDLCSSTNLTFDITVRVRACWVDMARGVCDRLADYWPCNQYSPPLHGGGWVVAGVIQCNVWKGTRSQRKVWGRAKSPQMIYLQSNIERLRRAELRNMYRLANLRRR